MNGNCNTCDVEKQCGYEYKPCDCCNYRKFKQKQHVTDGSKCWCEPVLDYVDPVTGAEVWIHNTHH